MLFNCDYCYVSIEVCGEFLKEYILLEVYDVYFCFINGVV